jgi:signal peptidase I
MIGPYVYDARNQNGQTVLLTPSEGLSLEVVRAAGIRQIREVSARERTVALTDEMAEALRTFPGLDSLVRVVDPAGEAGGRIFPENPRYPWNNDHLGPIYIPGKGDQVALNPDVLPLYKKIIRDYEGHEVQVSGNQVLVDGEPADTYTFAQDYYWMMGDNRDHSEDSRAWGYVPANHIVGKPVFIWMSFDNFNMGMANWKPRWDRIFTTVSGEGEPRSYFRHFLFALAAYFLIDYLWRRRRRKRKKA